MYKLNDEKFTRRSESMIIKRLQFSDSFFNYFIIYLSTLNLLVDHIFIIYI